MRLPPGATRTCTLFPSTPIFRSYISKPFSQRLLSARIRAILRRADYGRTPDSEEAAKAVEPIVRGRLEMDPARHRVKWEGNDVTLTVTELDRKRQRLNSSN